MYSFKLHFRFHRRPLSNQSCQFYSKVSAGWYCAAWLCVWFRSDFAPHWSVGLGSRKRLIGWIFRGILSLSLGAIFCFSLESMSLLDCLSPYWLIVCHAFSVSNYSVFPCSAWAHDQSSKSSPEQYVPRAENHVLTRKMNLWAQPSKSSSLRP